MDEITREIAASPAPAHGRGVPDDQPRLPFDVPFDDEADRPIGYSLTARARRKVAPEALPTLRVLAGATPATQARRQGPSSGSPPAVADGALDQPDDARPSRARALRRSGVGVAAIARQLGTDELVVRAWVGDVAVHPTATRRDRAAAADGHEHARRAEDRRRHDRLEAVRLAAGADARDRLHHDPAFAAGLGLLVALATIDEHAVTLVTTARDVAASIQAWLLAHAGIVATDVRIVLRLGPDVAGDLARRRWSDALGVPPERIVHTRWRGAPTPDAEEALIRVPDAELAAKVAGWRHALLEPDPDIPADGGF
jgi:hypothetical protein